MSLPYAGPVLFGHAGLAQALDEHVPMGEAVEGPAHPAEAQRRGDPLADGDEFVRLAQEPEMAAATDERVVVAGEVREGRHRGSEIGQRLLEALRAEEGEAVDRGVE